MEERRKMNDDRRCCPLDERTTNLKEWLEKIEQRLIKHEDETDDKLDKLKQHITILIVIVNLVVGGFSTSSIKNALGGVVEASITK